jgi:transcriptional regulator
VRHSPHHAVTDPEVVRTLITENPWATLVSVADGELVASHYPVLLDEDSAELAVLTHVGRPDEQVHDFGEHEMLLIVAGPHGYISPSWYAPGATRAPTWNFSVAHCYGTPQILDPDENIRVLTRLVAHFEQQVEQPLWLEPETAERLAPGTVGIRLPITRFICKVKLSRDKDPQTQRQIVEQLRRPGPYAHPALAREMERGLGSAPLPPADPLTRGPLAPPAVPANREPRGQRRR